MQFFRGTGHTVTLYGRDYRAIVIHSSAHDKRRTKKLKKEILKSTEKMDKVLKEATRQIFYCKPDAETAVQKYLKETTSLHGLDLQIESVPQYGKGRPPENKPRPVKSYTYKLVGKIVDKTEEMERLQVAAGCFVMLCNIPREGKGAYTGAQVLKAYKEQHGVEKNFGFLKDDAIVNAIFLKNAERIEALGLILLLSLLIWRLIEFQMRSYLKESEKELPGWAGKKTLLVERLSDLS